MSIEIRNIRKSFGNFVAVANVNFKVETGELVALLGPSGSGKTTLLRIIAGIERPDDERGAILIHNEDTSAISFRDRRVGFVFQHYALFRHMTIFENVAFGLRVRPRRFRLSDKAIRQRGNALLNLVHLDWHQRPLSIAAFRRAATAHCPGAGAGGGAQCAALG